MPEINLDCKAPSRHEVENWLDRIDDITAAVQEILNEDPMEAERKREEREARRREAEARERRDKVKMRYDPRYYSRFENDEFIDTLLKEADGPTCKGKGKNCNKDEALFSRAERVSLDEALRMKEEAAKAVRASDWETAFKLYSNAIGLNVVDASLQVTLHNNRALVQLKLKRYLDAVEDASYVLREEPTNVKALLRRATALRHLRRPLDALRDAEAALQKDVSNQEAADLAQWLRRIKSEHERCAAFQHHYSGDAEQLSKATCDLIAAEKELPNVSEASSEESRENVAEKQGRKRKCMMRVLKAVCRCLKVVQCFHLGAAVLFALRDGMGSLTELILGLLSGSAEERFGVVCAAGAKDMSPEGMVLFASLRLLSLVLVGSEACADELEPSSIHEMANNLTAVLLEAVEGMDKGTARGVNIETCLSLVSGLLQALEGLATRFPNEVHTPCGPVMEKISESVLRGGRPAPQPLYFLCGLLEALLKVEVVAKAMTPTLEKIGVRVVDAALTAGPTLLKEVGLSLAVRVSCTNHTCAKAMSTSSFTCALAQMLPPPKVCASAPLSARAEEGLFALVYNLFLQAESRRDYVKQWCDTMVETGNGKMHFALCAWYVLRDRAQSGGVSTERATVCSKMTGVLSKFSPFDDSLRDAILKDEGTLWSMLDSALSILGGDAVEIYEAEAKRDGLAVDSEGSEAKPSALWEVVEHTTTLLAGFYSKKLLSSVEGLWELERVRALLRVVQLGGDRHAVAVGNAALICSFVPPAGCEHYVALRGVDVLLESLRKVRASLFSLEHEGKNGTPQWCHARAAQKNVAIALSRCCTVESQRERLRELKGFETLHAVLEQQQAS